MLPLKPRLFSILVSRYLPIRLATALLIATVAPSHADDFPMLGQTWVFINGPSEDTHIVQSVSEFAPSSVIIASFNPNGTADFRYSNLSGRFLKSTTEAIDSITIDLRRNVLRNSSLFSASKQNIPDTAFSCDEELARLAETGRYSGFFINGQPTSPSHDTRTWHWTYQPPDCYASRPARAQDRQEKDLCQAQWCTSPLDGEEAVYKEACDEAFIECRVVIEEESMRPRPSTRMFWNLHLHPSIVLHPRHPATGRIMKEISLSEEQALEKRAEAIGHPSNQELKPYLNPVMDDSSSVYFSAQFVWPDAGPNGVWSIGMEVRPEADGATGFYHDPPSAYRIQSFSDWAGLQKALLLPFAKDETDKAFLSDIDTRCPGWAFQDRIIGQQAFLVKAGLDVTLPDVLPAETSDPAWARTRQEKVPVYGGWEIRTIVEENRILNDQVALIRNIDFPYGDYFWKGCPDLEDGFFHLTKSQLIRMLAMPIPLCNQSSLAMAEGLYRRLQARFNRLEDKDEMALAGRRADEAAFLSRRDQGKDRPVDLKCPDTPLDVMVRRISGP